MTWITLRALLLSLIPGLFWLWYIQGLGRTRREPIWMMALACLAGAASAEGVLLSSDALDRVAPGFMDLPYDPWKQLFYFIVAVGLMEEGWKMLSCWLSVYFLKDFDEPVDGLLYAGCSALGFATAENVKYILAHGELVLVGRALLSTFGHVLMSGVWGYALGMRKARGKKQGPLWLIGLFGAALGHGFFDWFLMQGYTLLGVATLGFLWWLFSQRIEETARLSPYRTHRVHRVRECPNCGILSRAEGPYCSGCGKQNEGPAMCPNCLKPAEGESSCERCGCLFAGN